MSNRRRHRTINSATHSSTLDLSNAPFFLYSALLDDTRSAPVRIISKQRYIQITV